MEICKMLTISTAHISETTYQQLLNDPESLYPIIVYPKDEYGWFIHKVKKFDDGPEHIPADMDALIQMAEREGCDWLCLDRDGDIISGFTVYEW